MSSSSPSETMIFISFANKDLAALDELKKHLIPLLTTYPLLQLYDSRLLIQSPRAQTIEEHLDQADLVILLVTADFLQLKRGEMQKAIQLKRDKGTRVILSCCGL